MTALAHATLQRLRRGPSEGKDKPARVLDDGPAVSVQFNPVSLRISRNNNTDRGGTTTRTQKRQHPAQEGSTLTFDLEFDTAEQRSGGQYVDVRLWTALVRQFVEPPKGKAADPPPVVRFVWGTLRYNGIVTQVNEELDYFAPDGTPLRAKVGVTIVEQNFAYEAHDEGPGTRDTKSATEPGAPRTGAAPGTSGTARPQQVVQAQEGESAQQLLSRLGLDPAAWRGAMSGLDSPLTLAAGASVQLGAEVSAGFSAAAGIRLSAGFAGGIAATSVGGLSAALGMGGGPVNPRSGRPGRGPAVTAGGGAVAAAAASVTGAGEGADSGYGAGADAALAGFALSAGGGIAASADAVLGAAVELATARARQSFEMPASAAPGPYSATAAPGRGPYPAVPGPGRTAAARPAAPPGALRRPDRRSVGYGQGVPLRARADAATLGEAEAGGGRSLADRARHEETPAPDPGAAPWERLPPDPPGRYAADCEQRRRDAGLNTLGRTPRGGPT
ncbi:hypothetical protein Snoj_42980 [Streptomyces nojiriensis]|uniref:Contractile injection system tube protein N-terminal domain-containing protein n=2 Tax=Streptomyces nojiriensis TaxID=66374 RepID=A0ABQ3SRH3_9ACTN|nr:hypothetical protein [Streptomyces nojiriensis]QTI43913.1 hypothetical protein JYK04_01676 [Streptomyces nojiriensis]GGR84785.1 hypothetical protein GCM10010205_11640 [Streptomyces nojiriensis]GHI70380.1 hypothetical protein Snoj_42980 [Streptomyces nojiriensis]